MLLISIKYFVILLTSFYIYMRLLHIKPSKKALFSYIICFMILAPVVYYLRITVPPISVIIMVLIFALLVKVTFKTSLNLSLITSVISFGISYTMFLIAMPIAAFCAYLSSIIINRFPSDLFSQILLGFTHLLITLVPFQFKRLRKGMPFLSEQGSNDVGVYISLLMLASISVLGVENKPNLVYLIPIFISFTTGLTLFFWWKKRITQNYIKNVKANEIEALQKVIAEKDIELEHLRCNHDKLSAIVHKDNKLIPAMEYAVRAYLSSEEQNTDDKTQNARAKSLLEHMSNVTQERIGILKNYEITSKKLPSTNVVAVDTLLTYMHRKANEAGCELDISFGEMVQYLVAHYIEESDLTTVLADLIDNAIIATKTSEIKRIRLSFNISELGCTIDILDSGEPFKDETLRNIGVQRTSTHLDEGGSGIGLMTTFEIIKKYHASFEIKGFCEENTFTKQVSVCFDNMAQFRVINTGDSLIGSTTS